MTPPVCRALFKMPDAKPLRSRSTESRAERFIEGTVTPAPKPMTQRGMAIVIKP